MKNKNKGTETRRRGCWGGVVGTGGGGGHSPHPRPRGASRAMPPGNVENVSGRVFVQKWGGKGWQEQVMMGEERAGDGM